MGLGRWSKRERWPLNYVRTVKEIKIYGIYVLNSYQSILKRNWDHRLGKFQQSLMSWSSRTLNLLVQRVEVLKIFALSRVYYVASVLPMTKTMGNKFEKLIGKFIWSYSGKPLRVALSELKLPAERGGLGLVCIHSMSKSLFLTQFLRLLKYSPVKTLCYVDHWLGELLVDLVPDLDQCPHPVSCPAYMQSIALALTDAKISDILSSNNWKELTNRKVYKGFTACLPAPKVENDSGLSMSQVWKRLGNCSLSYEMHEILFLLIHRKLLVKERLFRINLADDPYCESCSLQLQMFVECDFEHFFCICPRVLNAWSSIKNIILNLLQAAVSDQCLISLDYPSSKFENEIIWILGSYLLYVWQSLHSEGASSIERKKLFGFLKFKYKASQLGARSQLHLPINTFH